MSFITYISPLPIGSNNPTVDRPNMTNNNANIPMWMIVDHYGYNDNRGGYHNIIHQPPFVYSMNPPNPPAITGIGQTYVKTVGSDQQLFYQSGGGFITQLTGPIAPRASGNGFVYVSGGILLQWGNIAVAKSGTLTPVLFATSNINFPNVCFNIQLTMINNQGTGASANGVFVSTGTVSTTGFTIINTSSSVQSCYWSAIGN